MLPKKKEDWYHPLWEAMMPGKVAYEPFTWQEDLIHIPASDPLKHTRMIGACGRRSGKTTAIVAEVVREAFTERRDSSKIHRPSMVYVIAPNYELAMKIWEPIWELFVPDHGPLTQLKKGHDKQRKIIDLAHGGRIQAKTADDPKSLQGDRVTAAFVDEAHDINEEAWANFMPALTDSKGVLRAIGIAKGKSRFRSYFQRGLDTNEDRFNAFSVASTENPYIDPQELELMREDLTDNEFKQQYLAEWAEDDGQVFKSNDELFDVEDWQIFDGPFLMGLDIGKLNDYTVAYVVDIPTMSVVAMDRFSGLDYTVLVPRVTNLFHSFACQTIHTDASGVGEPVVDMLRREGCSVSPFKFTNQSKAKIISGLAAEIEHKRVHFLKNDEQLRKELNLYEGKVMAGGQIRYSAPVGYHDDCVIALALAVEKAKKRRNTSRGANAGSYLTFSESEPWMRRW